MFIDANIFQPLISVFQSVLQFFHDHVGFTWGFSIIALTICVRLVLLPLALTQFRGMRRMQHHQPEMKAIQQKYKNDKQRQQQEMMKFYRENGINPLASCLPLVAQLPVFISLYYMLRNNLRFDICPSVQRHYQQTLASLHGHAAAVGQTTYCTNPSYAHYYHGGAGFLFIKDITNQAHGWQLILLCVIYVGTQMASTLLMSAPTMDKTQRRIMAFLPLIFVLFIIRFPAGLLLYWITTNAWTMGQQFTLKKVAGAPMVPEVIDADSGGDSGGNGSSAVSRIGAIFTPRANREEKEAAAVGAKGRSGGKADSGNGGGSRGTTPAKTGTGARGTTAGASKGSPPPSARKKKKRSGRKR